jgi:RNA polymerase sigma-70 factor (ECF subfamily)
MDTRGAAGALAHRPSASSRRRAVSNAGVVAPRATHPGGRSSRRSTRGAAATFAVDLKRLGSSGVYPVDKAFGLAPATLTMTADPWMMARVSHPGGEKSERPSAVTAAMRPDDLATAEACAGGDSAAFERIYQQYGDRMKSVAFNHLGNRSDAEDAVQETFFKVHRSASTYTGESSFSTWLFRVLINTCYDVMRKRGRRIEETSLDDWDPPAASPDVTRQMTLRRLLAELPEQRRSVFILFEVEGLSHKEIGETLSIKETYSKWLLFMTRRELQQRWESST